MKEKGSKYVKTKALYEVGNAQISHNTMFVSEITREHFSKLSLLLIQQLTQTITTQTNKQTNTDK